MECKKIYVALAFALSLSASCREDVCRYANPLIGTADNGHTFPGACVPFGFVQPSPDSGNCRWEYCSGFNIADTALIGFSQTHLNGTGCSDLGDVLILPFSTDAPLRHTPYVKESLSAVPGYCSVEFDDGIFVEMTATQRVAQYSVKYADSGRRKLYVDLQNGNVNGPGNLLFHVLEADVSYDDEYTLSGMLRTKNWTERQWYFVMKFSEPYIARTALELHHLEKADKVIFEFAPSDRPLGVKVAMSTVGVQGAAKAIEAEAPGWNFNEVRSKAHKKWHDLLSRVEVKGSEEQKMNVYTSLYHLFVQPNNIADIDGRYRDAKNNVRQSDDGDFYSTFSLWDTYRAANPFYALFNADMVDGFINSLLDQFDVQGYLPVWPLWGKETHCMIGNHAVPTIVEAYFKGYRGFDVQRAWNAVKTTLTTNHERSSRFDIMDKYGYYPFDLVERESVSRTMEMCYDDYCASLFARDLGYIEDAEFFAERSRNWLNLFDHESGLVRGKDSNGNWRTPFDRFAISHAATHGGDYTEGNAWQYTWHVQQDPYKLIELMGGPDKFETKLDSLFFLDTVSENNTGFVGDVTGLIGQYAHGNEPSHHVAYLYQFAGKPWKTQSIVREVFDRFYRPLPDGLCGNDDCGQMSAWYLFGAMGFYPVDPVSLEYVLGAPQIPYIRLHLQNGNTFTVKASGISMQNKYVERVLLNGQELQGFKLRHQDIVNGGVLEFIMTSIPSNEKN
ncbi:MAG: GH92 family glycosyl hydrolase [Clostridium sp.]|nr:GH92 family glycosyl hydrolase [Bacteroides sp.]MCM1197569.1 GH92 family glycosyl hydrolase [Clostridium sp.]